MPNMGRWYPVGVTLFLVKKRTRVLVGVAAGVVVLLLLAGALLLQPPVPYDFLRGAKFNGVWTYSIGTVVSRSVGPSTPPKFSDTVSRQYWTPRSLAELEKPATSELLLKGWSGPAHKGPYDEPLLHFRTLAGESIQISPAENGGCYVNLSSMPNTLDRFQSWLWNLTHR